MKTILRHRGFTLVELLAVIGVIGVLVSLSLPAVQAAREAANRIRCANNLKQIGIALQSYETVWAVFPPSELSYDLNGFSGGSTLEVHRSVHSGLLAHIEQSPLYDALNVAAPCSLLVGFDRFPANLTVARTKVATYLCPADGQSEQTPFGATNYRACSGTCGFCQGIDSDGAFNFTGTRLAEFRDGLSQTLAFSERLVGSGASQRFRPERDWILNRPSIANSDPSALSTKDWLAFCGSLRRSVNEDRFKFDSGHTWLWASTRYTEFFTIVPPNSSIPDCGGLWLQGYGVFGARSAHSGGVNALLADGSARFYANGINLQFWRALGTRGGGEAAASSY